MEDIVFNIYGFLDVGEIVKCSLVCKLFNKISKNNMLWKGLRSRHIKCFEDNYYETYKLHYGLKQFKTIIWKDIIVDRSVYDYDIGTRWIIDKRIVENNISVDELYMRECIYIIHKDIWNIPYGISTLQNLKRLQLYNCNLISISPQIGQLQNLQELVLRRNGLRDIPKEIGMLKNLIILDVSLNYSLETLPSELRMLNKLEFLNICYCYLKLFPMVICKMENLQDLSMGYNKMNVLPHALSNLKKLRMLNIHNNKIRKIPQELKDNRFLFITK